MRPGVHTDRSASPSLGALLLAALLLVGASIIPTPCQADDLDDLRRAQPEAPADTLGDAIRELLAELATLPGVEVLTGAPIEYDQVLHSDPTTLAPERLRVTGFLTDVEPVRAAAAGDVCYVWTPSLTFEAVPRSQRRPCGCVNPDLDARPRALDLKTLLEAASRPEEARRFGSEESLSLALAASLRGHATVAVRFLEAVLAVNAPDADARLAQLRDLRQSYLQLLLNFTWRRSREPSWTATEFWWRVEAIIQADPTLEETHRNEWFRGYRGWVERRAEVVARLERQGGWRALSTPEQAEVLVALLPEHVGLDLTGPNPPVLAGTAGLVEGTGRTSPVAALQELGAKALPALLDGVGSDFPTREGSSVAYYCRMIALGLLGFDARELDGHGRGPEAARAWREAILQGMRTRETLGEARWLAERFALTGDPTFGDRLARIAPDLVYESHARALAAGFADLRGACRRLLRHAGEPGRRLVAEVCARSDPRLALAILPRSDLSARARTIAWWHEANRRHRLRIAEARRWIAGEPHGAPVDLTAPWRNDSGQGPALLHPDAFVETMISSHRPELIAAVARAIPSLDAARREIILLTLNPRASSAAVRALSQEICRACLDDHRPVTLVDLEDLPVRVCDLATSKLLQLRGEPGCALGHVEPERREAARLALKRRLATGRRDDRASLCRRPRPLVARRLRELVQDALRQGPPPDAELARLSRRDRRGLSRALRRLGPEANPLRLALCRTGAILNTVQVDPRGLPVAPSCVASLALQKGEPLDLAELIAPLSRALRAPEPAEHDGWGRPRPGRLTLTLRRRPGEPGFRAIIRAEADPLEAGPAFPDDVPPHPLQGVFRLGLRKGHRGLTYDDDLDSVERRAGAIAAYAEAVEWTLGADAGARGVEIVIDVAARLAPAPDQGFFPSGIRLRD